MASRPGPDPEITLPSSEDKNIELATVPTPVRPSPNVESSHHMAAYRDEGG